MLKFQTIGIEILQIIEHFLGILAHINTIDTKSMLLLAHTHNLLTKQRRFSELHTANNHKN